VHQETSETLPSLDWLSVRAQMASMEQFGLAVSGLLVVSALFTALWVASTIYRKASIVDVFWSLAFLVLALWFLWQTPERTLRSVLIVALVAIWAVRLAGYLAWRTAGAPEDHRYAKMREACGSRFWWVSLFTVFWLQAFLAWIISLPLWWAITHSAESQPLWDALAFVLWAAGFTIETTADAQLARFKSDQRNAGQVLQTGLWRYSRHPNYFGEAVLWWGFYGFAVSSGGWWTILSPLLMTFLLLKVSGIPLLEPALVERRSAYAGYIRRTPAFFPWFPKREGPGH